MEKTEARYLNTFIFNVFVFCQIFNEYNARVIGDALNVFFDLHKAPMFLAISVFSSGAQVCLRAAA